MIGTLKYDLQEVEGHKEGGSKISPTCYRCGAEATSVEHVPARCFFPKGQRNNLITVPSCAVHNNETSKDDEYVRNVIVASKGNNELAARHWRGDVRKSFVHSPKLFLKTFKHRKDNSFFQDRLRVDAVMKKIAYALYFHIYKKPWHSYPAPFYTKFYDEEGNTDIQNRLSFYKEIPYSLFDGANPAIFKYQYFEGQINGEPNCHFKLVFYNGFEVIIIPTNNPDVNASTSFNLLSK